MTRIALFVIAAFALGLSACTNPYDPVQRGLGGGILGAASGAAIGAAAGGGPGAALGAAIGGATGIFGESLLHLHPHRAPISATQPTDLLVTGIRATRSRAMDIRATRDTPLTPVLRATHTQATRVAPLTPVLRGMDCRATRDTPPTPVPRPMDTRAARHTLPVPVMDIPCLVIPETALRRTGRLGPSTLSSLLAELRPRIHPQCLTHGGTKAVL